MSTKFKLIIVFGVLAQLAGCATGYGPASRSITGGYIDDIRARNEYLVTFSANGYTSSDRAHDMALMRAAELTLMHGYKYFLVFDSDTAMNEDLVYTGYGVSSSLKPISKHYTIAMRNEPKHYERYFDAEKTFSEMAKKYELYQTGKMKEFVTPQVGDYQPLPEVVSFSTLNDLQLDPIAETDVEVLRGVDQRPAGLALAYFGYWENPVGSLEEFIKLAKPHAAKHGANRLLIEDDSLSIHAPNQWFPYDVKKRHGFVAELIYSPSATFGVQWDRIALRNGRFVVRRYQAPGSESAGLLLGDDILEIDGIDVMNKARLYRHWSTLKPGSSVKVAVIRSGREVNVSVRLFADAPQ